MPPHFLGSWGNETTRPQIQTCQTQTLYFTTTMRHVTANLWHNRWTKSEEARSIGCLTTQKSGEARASVPQWFRRLCPREWGGSFPLHTSNVYSRIENYKKHSESSNSPRWVHVLFWLFIGIAVVNIESIFGPGRRVAKSQATVVVVLVLVLVVIVVSSLTVQKSLTLS